MAKLILSRDGNIIQELGLEKERTTIGRRPYNDIVLEHLAISGEHAVVTKILNDAFLEDLNSTNGTWVNGLAIKKHFLQNGDVIELGKFQLQYVTGERVNQATTEHSGLVEGSSGGEIDTSTPRATSNSVGIASPDEPNLFGSITNALKNATKHPAHLEVLSGSKQGTIMPLTKSTTTLGSPNKVVVAITRRPQGFFVHRINTPGGGLAGAHLYRYLNSKLGARPTEPLSTHHIFSEPLELTDQDEIDIAGTRVRFVLK